MFIKSRILPYIWYISNYYDYCFFFRFPVDPKLHNDWVSTVRQNRKQETWTASKFCVICSAHFKEEDIYLKGKKHIRCLKKHAKPQLVVERADNPEKANTHQEAGPSHERTTDEKIADQVTGLSPERTTDNDNFDDIKDSDLESIFDTPRKNRMRKELRRQKLVSVINKKKIQTLQQKVRRLNKKNASLKNILKELNEKHFINIDTHKVLSENIVATELFHHLNRSCAGMKKLKYSPAMRKFCLTLNFYSPRSYEYVRKVFNTCLPHPKTLAKWYTRQKWARIHKRSISSIKENEG